MSCFLVFNNNLITTGYNRSLILDFNRNSYRLIPNVLAHIILKNNYVLMVSEIIEAINSESDRQIFRDYLIFLEKNKLGTYIPVELKDQFPKIKESIQFPYAITNCIIDNFHKQSKTKIKEIAAELSDFNCYSIQLRFFEIVNFEIFMFIINVFDLLNIKSIDIIISYNDFSEKFDEIVKLNQKINSVIVFNAPYNKRETQGFNSGYTLFTDQKTINRNSCGIVSKKYFNLTKEHYLESLSKNSCLNKKISIDENGDIKNCPSMKENFGNITNTSLASVLSKKAFTKYWGMKKDKINICKDCEFRHICTDCRAFIEDPNDMYSKPLKCGYSPYTNLWEEWSKNPLKQSAIDIYNLS